MPERQHTVRDVAVVRHVGAFTGDEITVEIHPARPDHGPSFELVQADETYTIPVSVENIVEADNNTVLADIENPRWRIMLVEHILATLHGMGIDNALIRVDSTEIPLIDGSADAFVKAVDRAGLVEQDAPRREIVIREPIFIDDGPLLMVLPCEALRLTYFIHHPDDIVGRRLVQIDVTPGNFREHIGPARTFITEEKARELMSSGNVRNTNEDQVLVVYRDRTSKPLQSPEEFCYHKMLDILGDLYLTGRRLRGHVIGIRSGHIQNRKMARMIAERYL